MLNTQVQYWANVEQKRHNLATEKQTDATIQEQKRHNVKTETQTDTSLAETARHNVVQEQFNWANLEETARHNVQSEQLGWSTLSETTRHNVATESEINRHNKVQESIGWSGAQSQRISALASQQQAQAAMMNARTNQNVATSTMALNFQKVEESKENQNVLKQKWANMLNENELTRQKISTEVEKRSYLGQENARAWVNTVISGIGAFGSFTK